MTVMMHSTPKPWDLIEPSYASTNLAHTRSEPCLPTLRSLRQPKALDTRTNALPSRSMSPLEILEAERSGLENFDPTGRWYRPDRADDFHMSKAADINKHRAQQADLHAALDAQVASRRAEKAKTLEQRAERFKIESRAKRFAKSSSVAAVHKEWTYCDAPDFFIPPIIDNSPSKKCVKNHFITGMWDGLEGAKPAHHQYNIKGVWDYSDKEKCLSKPVPAERMGVKDKKTAKILAQKLEIAHRQSKEDARKATSGPEKRAAVLRNAEKFSANQKEPTKPWILQRVATRALFSDEIPLSSSKAGLDPYLDGETRVQVSTTGRAHDYCRNFVGGNTAGASKWNAPPAGSVVGTQRRREQVAALVNRRTPSTVPAGPTKSTKERRVSFKDPEPTAEFAAEAVCQVIDLGTLE